MNILIFITHKRSTISEARVWKQVSVRALFLLVILVLSEVFKFRQIHLQGINEFIIWKTVKEKSLSSGQTLGVKELAQAREDIAKNTERAEPILFAEESSADFMFSILTTFIQLATAFDFWMFWYSFIIILDNNSSFSG